MTKYFAGQLTAVDVFYSIHKAAIFSAKQRIFAVCQILTLFPFLTSNSTLSYGIKLNFGSFFLRYLDLCMKNIGVSLTNKMVVDRYFFRLMPRELRSKTYKEKG